METKCTKRAEGTVGRGRRTIGRPQGRGPGILSFTNASMWAAVALGDRGLQRNERDEDEEA